MRIDLSEQSLDALAQVISGGSANNAEPPIGVYRQGWKIEAWFKAFGVPVDLAKESRLAATRTALNWAVFVDNGNLVERIIERAADPRDFITEPERHAAVLDYLNRHLAFDGLKLETIGNRVQLSALTDRPRVVGALSAAAARIDFDTVSRDIERALRTADDDPEMAVTSACALVESVCRSILVEIGTELPAKQDINGLYRAVREPLGLSPTKEGVSVEIVNDVRAVLSGLVTTVQSIGSLRTHVGGAHGKERGFRRIDPRIAKLAIHSASAVAVFLIETWELRFPGRKLDGA